MSVTAPSDASDAHSNADPVCWADLVMERPGWRDHAVYNRDCDAAFAQLQPVTALRPFTADVPTVICVVRNEERRLPDFLDHYKRLGVSCLHIVDNASTDRTAEICTADPHVTLWRTAASYREANYGQLWVGALARRFGLGKWVLNVDADELLVYCGMQARGAGDLQHWLAAHGYRRIFAPMIDMYGSRTYGARAQPDRRPLLLQTPFFDGGCEDGRGSYEFLKTPYGPLLAGGPRNRILSVDDRKKFYLSKFPLTLWSAETAYANPHFPYPFADNPEAPLAALLHFKFLADFEDRVGAAINEEEHWRNAAEYREYQRWIDQGGGPAAVFSTAFSRVYRGPDSLLAAGLLQWIEW